MSSTGTATPGVYARARSCWVAQGLVIAIAIFPGRPEAWYSRASSPSMATRPIVDVHPPDGGASLLYYGPRAHCGHRPAAPASSGSRRSSLAAVAQPRLVVPGSSAGTATRRGGRQAHHHPTHPAPRTSDHFRRREPANGPALLRAFGHPGSITTRRVLRKDRTSSKDQHTGRADRCAAARRVIEWPRRRHSGVRAESGPA